VIILHTEASPGWGGQEHRILAEMQALRARNHIVHLAARPDGGLWQRARAAGFAVHAVPFRHRCDVLSIDRLRRIIRRQAVDVVNAHSAIDGWAAAFAAGSGVAVVRTRHLSIPVHRNWPTTWLYTRGCDAIVTTGEALRRQLMRENGFDGRRIVSVPTGVDLARFDRRRTDAGALRRLLPSTVPADAPLIGTIAMLRTMKGHHILVDALPAIRAAVPGAHLVLVGDQPHERSSVRADLLAQAAALGVADRVHLLGYRDDIPDLLAGLDAVCLPSTRDEGVPQGLTQALAMSVPTIATNVGAVSEVVRDGDTGWLVPPGAPSPLADAVATALTDRAEAARRAARGHDLVRGSYTVTSMADAMETVFVAAIDSRRAA
jgi:glycosyltransferase involved in cell wall biosynthesis